MKKVSRTVLSLTLGVLMCVAIAGCGKDKDKEEKPALSVTPVALSFTAQAAESHDVTVTTNQPSWDAVSSQAWCTVTKGNGKFTVRASANASISSPAPAVITVTAGNAKPVTINVTQSGIDAELTVNPDAPVSFTAAGGDNETKTIAVATNQPSWNVASSQTWCTVSKRDHDFTVTASAHTGADARNAIITVSAGNAANVTINVTQAGVGAQLSVSPNSAITFTKDGGTSPAIVVATNQPSWNATSNEAWCTVAKVTSQFTVTASANTSSTNRTATITVSAGNAPNVTLSVTQISEPNIAFVAGNPLIEYLYNTGFFTGCRINFNLVVYDAAGHTSITIREVAKGAPNGNSKEFVQTRVIPISGPGTYQLSQEIQRSKIYGNIYNLFNYTVSAYGKSYSTNYPGDYSSYNGAWDHYFVVK